MQNAADALQAILDSVRPVQSERCPLSSLYQRVLASDVIAPQDVPPFDNSSMDGYALRTRDVASATASAMVRLSLQGKISAGTNPVENLSQLHAMRIMTGAPVPQEADAVIEQELVKTRNGFLFITEPVWPGRNIRRKGEDIKTGSVVMKKGARLKSVHVGVLASLGIAEADVFRRPRVAFLTTGDELVGAEGTPGRGQIRNSNEHTLRGLLNENGCEPITLGSAADAAEELREKITHGLQYDALITSGGVSVGDRDLVLEVLRSVGVEIRFWKLNIKPGMPMAFGVSSNGVPVFALPGNPVSTVVTFLQFVRPGLQKRGGVEESRDQLRLKATLVEPIRKSDTKRHFIRGIVRNEKGRFVVSTTGSQSSGVLTSLTKANCLIIIPEEATDLRAGREVEVELL